MKISIKTSFKLTHILIKLVQLIFIYFKNQINFELAFFLVQVIYN